MDKTEKICLASDNYAGVCDEIMAALTEANKGYAAGYGQDPWTKTAEKAVRKEFGVDAQAYFVYTGTAANALAIGAALPSIGSVLCADLSHIAVQEVTAVQKWTGAKLIVLDSVNGKITAGQIRVKAEAELFWGRHTAIPSVVSITQPTEVGTLYSASEIRDIAKVCHQLGMTLHMDGARISNASVSLGLSLKKATVDLGVDVLSFGGTKNGLMFGEAIVFFNKKNAYRFEYFQKQGLQLLSKMRFVSAQYARYLTGGLWKANAERANQAAQNLAIGLENLLPGSILYPVQTNQIFIALKPDMLKRLAKCADFYIFDPVKNVARFVTSFNTTDTEIAKFLQIIEDLKNRGKAIQTSTSISQRL